MIEEKLTGLDFWNAWRIGYEVERKIRHKDGPWVKILRNWTIIDAVGNVYPMPTLEEAKEKVWEVEPEKPKEIFVWGATDENGQSWILSGEGFEEYLGENIFPKGKSQKYRLVPVSIGENIFPKGKSQKYRLVPVSEIPLPKT